MGNNTQNSLQFALREPEKIFVGAIYVDKTVDNRSLQKCEKEMSVYSG